MEAEPQAVVDSLAILEKEKLNAERMQGICCDRYRGKRDKARRRVRKANKRCGWSNSCPTKQERTPRRNTDSLHRAARNRSSRYQRRTGRNVPLVMIDVFHCGMVVLEKLSENRTVCP